MICVIVPAHDEADVIGRCLSALTSGARVGELDVIVVCNGCVDKTAAIARSFASHVRVIESEVASKNKALNMGDAAANSFPRFYIDADVVISLDAVRRMAEHLRHRGILAVSPQIRLDLDKASWAVRAFYQIDRLLPSHRQTIGGSGVYALSERGRRRFDSFPAVTADDGFVRRQFRRDERTAVEGCFSRVTPPRRLRGVITIKTRSHFGNYELDRLYPQLRSNAGGGNGKALLRLSLLPWLWPKLAVYGYVKTVARIRARWQLRGGKQLAWERDGSSRGLNNAPRTIAQIADDN